MGRESTHSGTGNCQLPWSWVAVLECLEVWGTQGQVNQSLQLELVAKSIAMQAWSNTKS